MFIIKRLLAIKSLCLIVAIFGFSLNSLADEDSPYSYEVVYTVDYLENINGGLKQDGAYLDNFDFLFDIDAKTLWGIDGGSFHLHILYNNSNTFSDIVGDVQTVSNIDNTSVLRLFEFWWQQNSGAHSVKMGLFDLNSEFDAIDTAGLFLNSSHGIGIDYAQSGENGPSIFPTTSLAFRYNYQLSDNLLLQAAILDAVPGDPDEPHSNAIKVDSDDLLLALEVNYTVNKTRFGVGVWQYTKETESLDGLYEDNNSGIYGIVEHQFSDLDDEMSINGWLRIGSADSTINQFGNYIGTGLVFSNFIQSRPDDRFGFAIARASNSNKYRSLNIGSDSNETVFEFTYQLPLNDYITIRPDIQYIINPGTETSLDNALIIGIRIEMVLL